MPSEYAPGGTKARMTNAQIRKMQREQEEARKIAAAKLAAAKKSDEWKKEEDELNSLENILSKDESLIATGKVAIKKDSNKNIKLSLWQKIILWFKNLFN